MKNLRSIQYSLKIAVSITISAMLLLVPTALMATERDILINGVKVVYDELGKVSDPAIVFVHGWCCDVSAWRLQTPAFSDNFHVLAIDLPGCGRSDSPGNIDYSLNLFADAVATVIADAAATPAVIVGHSMGYSVAVRLLERHPGLVRALVNVDGAYLRPLKEGQDPDSWEREMRTFVKDLKGPDSVEIRKWFIGCTSYGKTGESLQTEVEKMMLSTDEYVAYSSMAMFVNPEEWHYKTFDVPALAIYSNHEYHPKDNEADLRKYFTNLDYHEWNDTGHFLMMQRPERFNESLRQFIEGLK